MISMMILSNLVILTILMFCDDDFGNYFEDFGDHFDVFDDFDDFDQFDDFGDYLMNLKIDFVDFETTLVILVTILMI